MPATERRTLHFALYVLAGIGVAAAAVLIVLLVLAAQWARAHRAQQASLYIVDNSTAPLVKPAAPITDVPPLVLLDTAPERQQQSQSQPQPQSQPQSQPVIAKTPLRAPEPPTIIARAPIRPAKKPVTAKPANPVEPVVFQCRPNELARECLARR